MTAHPGDYIGGHSGIDPSTRKIVVAELRALVAKLDQPLFDGVYGADAFERGCHTGGRDILRRLTRRADEIESAGRGD